MRGTVFLILLFLWAALFAGCFSQTHGNSRIIKTRDLKKELSVDSLPAVPQPGINSRMRKK